MIKKRSRSATIIFLCGFLTLIYSFSFLIPIAVGWIYGEKQLSSFYITFVIALVSGGASWFGQRNNDNTLKNRDGFLVAIMFWLVFSFFSALPFMLDARLDLSVADAVFEGISGITTTGASVLKEIDTLPKSILYYRAQLNFLGGLGIIVLAVALLPLLGVGGTKLYQSEMPGPQKEDKMTPRLADTAKHLWFIYLGLASACALAFFIAGMGWFEAICHSLSTVSLGGFSTHADSLGFYQSPAIEVVGGVFSVLAAVNFALYFVAFNTRSLKPIIKNPEFRFFILIMSIVVAITCFELYRVGMFGWEDSLVHGFFQSISVMTDNGLGSANYPNWPPHIVLMLIGASFFGGCVGSTCGGIKAMRFLLLYHQSNREVKKLIHPHATFAIKIGDQAANERLMHSIWAFFFLYVLATFFFIWGLVATGVDLFSSVGTVSACINNMGLGYGITASTFGTLTDPAKWLMCLAMLLGRLEIFPILIILSKTYWQF
jgi:trk system potassium uptake protein TrkH